MQAADNDKADAVWCGGALRSTLAAARGTQEVALAACRRRCCVLLGVRPGMQQVGVWWRF